MLINRSLQKVINIIVIVMVVALVVVGGVLAIPSRCPFGPVLGKIFS